MNALEAHEAQLGLSEPAQGRSLTEQARERVLEDIIQCRLRPGDLVQLPDLARRYQMSRTPLREALTLLQEGGLVESVPYKGYLVKPIDRGDVEEIFFMRRLLEGAAAELAAERIDDAQLAALANLEAPETMVMTLSYDRYARTFHATVADAAGSRRLKEQILRVYNDVRRLQYAGIGRPRPVSITHEHDEILEALRDRDPVASRAAMTRHLDCIRERALGR